MRDYMIHRARGLDSYAIKETHKQYADQKKVRLEAAIMAWSQIAKNVNDNAVREEAVQRLKVLKPLLDQINADQTGDGK